MTVASLPLLSVEFVSLLVSIAARLLSFSHTGSGRKFRAEHTEGERNRLTPGNVLLEATTTTLIIQKCNKRETI